MGHMRGSRRTWRRVPARHRDVFRGARHQSFSADRIHPEHGHRVMNRVATAAVGEREGEPMRDTLVMRSGLATGLLFFLALSPARSADEVNMSRYRATAIM